ncbi:MAG: hypothetical protein E7052_05060 [Lentisphaerae bacterium]|nr:hypothetical protein [Lentisphaerota bacterium]
MDDSAEDEYAHIISFDWQNALFAYDLDKAGFIELEVVNTGEIIKSQEATGCGRLELENLPSDTLIKVVCRWNGGEKTLAFKTLPQAQGDLIGQFALIADPHISSKKENRKGRFFVESAALAEDVIKRCAELNITYTIWPGDITNAGLADEYVLCDKVLKNLPQKPYLVPGNHDHNPELWQQYFGVRSWVRSVPGIGKVIGIDTSSQRLLDEDVQIIKQELESAGRVVIVTHYQLFASPDINHVPPERVTPVNCAEHAELLQQISRTPSIIYAGHQNIMSVTRIGDAVQINLPQPSQYPCGWLHVRCFENGTYYTFEPITSEVMRQWSRRTGNAAAEFYNQRQWREEYRRGRFPESCNFFLENKNI